MSFIIVGSFLNVKENPRNQVRDDVCVCVCVCVRVCNCTSIMISVLNNGQALSTASEAQKFL